MTLIRTLVVDDEPLARQGLQVRLSREADIDLVGEAEDGPSAVQAILDRRPDLVFLDVQMPGFDGFEVLARTAAEHLPTVVFVTAHDEYALQAFGVHALDYLLKPIAHRRFQESLRRARAAIATPGDDTEGVRGLLDARDRQVGGYAVRFVVREGERYVLVRAADIDWVEAEANYLWLHVGSRTYRLRATIADLEQRLDPGQFARVHRSTIVNLDRVASIEPDFHAEYQLVLTTGAKLRMSRGYKHRLL